MNFRTYRKKMGWTLDDAARLLGLADGSTVARHEIGACLPGVEIIARYEKLTNKEVTVRDFVTACQQYRVDPDKARKSVGARRITRSVPV